MKINKMWFLFLIILVLPKVAYSDYVISAADGNVNIHFDTNAESIPTMNLNIQDFNINKSYENIDKENVFSKWLTGMLFVLLGFIVFFDAFFNQRYKSYI